MNKLIALFVLCGSISCLALLTDAQTTAPATTHASTTQSSATITVDWSRTIATSNTTPTLQVVVNPQLLRGSAMHDASFAALKALGADYVRYVPWYPYPHHAVAELKAPTTNETSWDFSHTDPTLDDFLAATAGHSVVLNFSTIPAWMWKQEWPTTVPDDPSQTVWRYVDGTELRDPTMTEAADYFARLLAWYTQGGFTDELGHEHKSGHHYKIDYWEVLNEPDFEHRWSPEAYTKFYDAVSIAMRKVNPNLKFVTLSLGNPRGGQKMVEYFLNPANHQKDAPPPDFISYHFYALSTALDQTVDDWQRTFFDRADGFLDTVRSIETQRKRLSPKTGSMLNELGAILQQDGMEIDQPGFVGKDAEAKYWNLAAAMYAYLYIETAKLGIDVVGESQLVGYHTQYPSVTMMDYVTSKPNARYWVLKLLRDRFGPGDQLIETRSDANDVAAQAFVTRLHGRLLILINKRNWPIDVALPPECDGSRVAFVAPSTGQHEAETKSMNGRTLKLEPFEVAVVEVPPH